MQKLSRKKLYTFILVLLSNPAFSYMDCTTSPNQALCEKTNALLRQVDEITENQREQPLNGKRKINRTTTDPYLVNLRTSQGLSPTLSDGEYYALSNATLDSHENDIFKLLSLASMSYLGSDVDASLYYFQRILSVEKSSGKKLPPESAKFISESISRLKNPNKFGGGIGFFVYKLSDDGVFDSSGIQVNDVIMKINGKIMRDSTEISQLLASSANEKVLTIMRGNKKINIQLKNSGSAGAQITPLIVFYSTQI